MCASMNIPHAPACDRFAAVTLAADPESIRKEDRAVLALLIRAAALLNAVYLRQVSHFNPQFKQEIEDTHSKKLIESFRIMGGPWDRFDNDRPFYGAIEKPKGAGFYPNDMTREEFNAWIDAHPEDAEEFRSFVTVIRRTSDGLHAVPYSQAYKLELVKAAALLREAAGISADESLRHFLNTRADALLSNDYAESDAAWIALASDIEVVFGPYETYEDGLFGYKATFEAFVGYRNREETERLAHIESLVDEMQEALPISAELKSSRPGGQSSPFVVIDLLSNAGEARVGVQTLAFVLPNDPVVVEKYGTKKVMMKNVQEAKFNAILLPIAERFLTKDVMEKVSFGAFFRHTILHETGHSLGPKAVRDGNGTIIHRLADLYSPIEECKADVTSTFLSQFLHERGELSAAELEETYATMVAGYFRSMRFGLSQAHARANAIQLNYLMECGAVTITDQGLFGFDPDKMRPAISSLVSDIMNIEYEGDYAVAESFINRYGTLSAELEERLGALSDIPVDISCKFEAERQEFFE